mgnify:CR=1 FL=1|tara:strand:+ start:509 stop:682 length:174 start_codon:yes stop_codon:yes gene_type:complete
MMPRYVVRFEVDTNEFMFASAENPFSYDSEPLIFLNKEAAETHAKKYQTGEVVEYPY